LCQVNVVKLLHRLQLQQWGALNEHIGCVVADDLPIATDLDRPLLVRLESRLA